MIATGTEHDCGDTTCGTGCMGGTNIILVDDRYYFRVVYGELPKVDCRPLKEKIEEPQELHWEDLSWLHDFNGGHQHIPTPQPNRRSMFSYSGFLPKRIRRKKKDK